MRARHAHRGQARGDPRHGRHAAQPRRRELRRSHPRAQRPRAPLAGDRARLQRRPRPRLSADQHRSHRRHARRDRRRTGGLHRAHARSRSRQRHDLPDGAAVQHDDQQRPPEARRTVRRAGRAAGRPSGAGWRRRSTRSSAPAITIGSAYTAVKDPAKTKFVYRDRLWQGADMVGLGVASFGHVNGVHLQNLDTWEKYSARDRAWRDSARPRLPADGRRADDPRVRAAAEARLGAARTISATSTASTSSSASAISSTSLEAAGYLAAAGPTISIALTRDGAAARRHAAAAVLPAAAHGNSVYVIGSRFAVRSSGSVWHVR